MERDCKTENYMEYCVLVLCLLNAIVMILKLLIHTVCYITYIVFLFTKLIKYERCGEAATMFAHCLKKPEQSYAEANKEDPTENKELAKISHRKSDKSEDVDRLRSIKEESKKSH